MKRDDERHGTYAGWQVHQREGKRACTACREARNAYMRKFRSETGADWRAQGNARHRALSKLARLYPDDYQRLYVMERLSDRGMITKGEA